MAFQRVTSLIHTLLWLRFGCTNLHKFTRIHFLYASSYILLGPGGNFTYDAGFCLPDADSRGEIHWLAFFLTGVYMERKKVCSGADYEQPSRLRRFLILSIDCLIQIHTYIRVAWNERNKTDWMHTYVISRERVCMARQPFYLFNCFTGLLFTIPQSPNSGMHSELLFTLFPRNGHGNGCTNGRRTLCLLYKYDSTW